MSHSHLVERLDDNGNTITVISVNIVQSNDVKMCFFLRFSKSVNVPVTRPRLCKVRYKIIKSKLKQIFERILIFQI